MQISAKVINSLKQSNEKWNEVFSTSARYRQTSIDTTTLIEATKDLDHTKDLIAMIHEHPETAYLFCNHRNQMFMVHAMRSETGPDKDDQFYGIIGNSLGNPHMEILIEEETFKKKGMKPTTKTPEVSQTQSEGPGIGTKQPDPTETSEGTTPKPKTQATKASSKSKGNKKTQPKPATAPTEPATVPSNLIRSILPIPPWMAAQILEIPQPLSHEAVKTKMTKISETILIDVESVPAETELLQDMIKNIKLFSERCTKKTDLFKTSVIPIQEEDLLEELFTENIPAELLVEYSKKILKEEEKVKSAQPVHPAAKSTSKEADKDSESEVDRDSDTETEDEEEPIRVKDEADKKTNKTATINKSSTQDIIQSLIQSGSVSPKYIIEQLLADKSDTAQTLVDLSKELTSDKASSKKNLFDNLPENQQLVFLRGSVESHDDKEPIAPYTKCVELFKSANKAKTMTTFKSLIQATNARGSYQRGHMTTATHKGLIWDDRNIPDGLSIFAIFPYSNTSPQDSEREIMASIKATHDNHLDEEDVRFLAKKSYHFPNDFPEMETMLSTFVAVLTILFGPQSLVARSVQTLLSHLKKNHSLYESQQQERPNWATRVLFSIDTNVQSYLRKLQSPEPLENIPTNNIRQNFIRLIDDIENRQLATTIPASIATLRGDQMNKNNNNTNNSHNNNNNNGNQNNNNNNGNNGKRRRLNNNTHNNNNNNNQNQGNQNGRQQGNQNGNQHNNLQNNNGQPNGNQNGNRGNGQQNGNQNGNRGGFNSAATENTRKNTKWLLPAGKVFYEVFHQTDRRQNAPKHNGTPFCLQFFTKGLCHRGNNCNLSHTDPRDCGQETAMDTFCHQAYNN
jgi:hypothetical protein